MNSDPNYIREFSENEIREIVRDELKKYTKRLMTDARCKN